MTRKAVQVENKFLREKLGEMKTRERLLLQSLAEKPKEVVKEVTKYVTREPSPKWEGNKTQVQKRERGDPRAEKYIKKLEDHASYIRELLKEYREILPEILDRDVWYEDVQDMGDGSEEPGLRCVFCDAPPVVWEHFLSFPHLEICPWKRGVILVS